MKPEPQFKLGDFVRIKNVNFSIFRIVDIFQGVHVSSHRIDDELVIENVKSGKEFCTPSWNVELETKGERLLKLFYG